MKMANMLLICVAAVAFAKGTLSNLPVTTTILSADNFGTITDIQSDGLGSYDDGVDADTSFLTTNGYNGIAWGDWQFGTLNSATRKVYLGFGNPISGASGGTATANPPFLSKLVVAHIEDKCTAFGYSMLKMSTGQKFLCPAVVHFFDSNGGEFRIYMAPNSIQPATPETAYVQVICNSVASDGCNDWFIDPIPSGYDANGISIPGQTEGRLVGPPYTGHGKTSNDGNQGDYYFRFHFHLTRP